MEKIKQAIEKAREQKTAPGAAHSSTGKQATRDVSSAPPSGDRNDIDANINYSKSKVDRISEEL